MNETSKDLRTLETALLALDSFPCSALYRIVIGLFIVPAGRWLGGGTQRGWPVVACFLGVLLFLRLVPAALRKILPVSSVLSAAWMVRRQMAKRFDSYQWQKLLWIGSGMVLSATALRPNSPAEVGIITLCLLSGGAGLSVWLKRSRALGSRPPRQP